MSKHILFYIPFCILFFLCACQGNEQRNVEPDLLELDVIYQNNPTDAKAIYEKARHLNQLDIDHLYDKLLRSLCSKNEFDLLGQHLYYYKQIAGHGKKAKAIIAKSDGLVYNFKSKYDSSKYFFNEAIKLFGELNAQKDIADCCYEQAMNYYYQYDFSQALDFNYKALNIYEKINDTIDIYKMKTEVADCYLEEHDYDSAITELMICSNYFQKERDTLRELWVLAILGKAYSSKNDINTALGYYKLSLSLSRKIDHKLSIAANLNNIATTYFNLKKWDKALSGFSESLTILKQLNETRQVPVVEENIADCMWQMGNVRQAKQLLYGIIDTAKQKGQTGLIANSYKLLYKINETARNYKSALDAFKQYKIYEDSTFNVEKVKAIGELNIKYETKKKEAQIAQLNTDKKIDALKKTTYLIVLFSIVVVAVLAILLMTNRNKKNKLVLKNVKLELEAKAIELAANTRELQTFTESVLNKNRIIEDLELKLQDKMKEIALDENNEQLSRLYQLKILTEDDWRQFKILFDKVYPGTISKLRECYPDLSPSEERQFLLTKLKIDNKESADMLGISILSVKKNRYRLKKRFNLIESQDLDEFVRKFEGKVIS